MRFAIGLLSGIVLTFGSAAVLDIAGLPTLLRQQAVALWPLPGRVGAAADTTPSPAEPRPQPQPDPQPGLRTEHLAVDEPETVEPDTGNPGPIAADPSGPDLAGPGPVGPEPMASEPTRQTLVEADTARQEPADLPPLTAEAIGGTVAAAVADDALEPASSGAGTEYIWQGFRSEMSARGFARHLEATLNRRLEVHKAAPGRYLVGFHYESAAERESLLQAVAEAMGNSQ